MLIAFEGVDASGKETQANLLIDRLRSEGRHVLKAEFPNYGSDSSGAVRMYLNGDFGSAPDDVNPYAASTFYAVDRFASYKTDWGEHHKAGGIVVADRYTMSNMIHQGAKIASPSQRLEFIEWLVDLEFVKMELPRPDIVIFLDLSPELRVSLMESRMSGDPSRRRNEDIHERDRGYLERAHRCARETAARLAWTRIDAERGGALRAAVDIHAEIYAAVSPLLLKSN